jgi:serine/threonine-protein kinase
VTARPAFDGENAIDTLSAILHHDPPPVTRTNQRAPVQLADIISRLLSKSPDDRYSSTRDLARELRLLRDRVAAEESGFHKPRPETRKPTGIIIGAVALLLFLAGVFMFTRQRTPDTPAAATAMPAAKTYLAVMRFKDLSGDPNGQLVVDGFAETLTARLAHFPSVQVMRPPASDPTNGDPRKTAKDLGANMVLTGSMMREGERIRVTYSVLDSKSGREWRDLVEGRASDLFGVQDDVAASVARNLDLGATPARPPLDPAVSQQRYLEAVGHLRRYDDAQSVDNAIGILESLGDSPSVQAALARAYLYKFELTRQPQYAANASSAAERALKADPQSTEVHITLGELRRRTGRHKEAIDAFTGALSQQPNNADAVLGLAEAYKAAGDYASAEAQYKRAIALQPNYWGGYNKLGAFYYTQSRYDEAIPQFQTVTRLVPDNERGFNNLGAMYLRTGRYKDALRVFQESIQRKPTGQAYSNLGTCYYFLGRFGDAAAAFEKAVALLPHDFLYWRNLGDAYRWVPEAREKSRRSYARAIELCDEAIRVDPTNARAHLSRATALAKIGRTREARSAIVRALELEPKNAAAAYEAAVIANIAGDEEETITRLEQTLRLGYNADDALHDPEFANLRKNGRLEAIIAASRSTPR